MTQKISVAIEGGKLVITGSEPFELVTTTPPVDPPPPPPPVDPPPTPGTITRGVILDRAELMALPTNTPAWNAVYSRAKSQSGRHSRPKSAIYPSQPYWPIWMIHDPSAIVTASPVCGSWMKLRA